MLKLPAVKARHLEHRQREKERLIEGRHKPLSWGGEATHHG